MQTKNLWYIIFVFFAVLACKKSSFLDAVPDRSLVVPQSLSDFQALLDNDVVMNGSSKVSGLTPEFEETGTDDYFVNAKISALDIAYTYLYTWDDNMYQDAYHDWPYAYKCIFYANSVLDGLKQLDASTKQEPGINNAQGSALFYRAHMFYHLAQVFAPVYDSGTANKDLGIPLRLTSDINESIHRSTLQQTYDRIIEDLGTAIPLLPVTALYKTRPCKAAVYGLLAKVFLSIRDYSRSLLYADSCLQLQGALLDYNLSSTTSTFSFTRFNNEVVFQCVQISDPLSSYNIGCVDSSLYNSYNPDDLRKVLFYKPYTGTGNYYFKGSYDGSYYAFSGIATDEMYLIRAEGHARAGNTALAMSDLNKLLQTRWKAGTYKTLTAVSAGDALSQILAERRKELVFRGARWIDLRRLNKEGANITVTRKLNGQSFTLPPNSLHYTYLIPPDVIGFNAGMPQNPR